MMVLKKLMFVSIATSGLLFACPNMAHHEHVIGASVAPKGVVKELYATANLKQKREIAQIEFDTLKAVKAQTEKFKQYRDAVEFDVKNLRLDLEEAQANRNVSKATETLLLF